MVVAMVDMEVIVVVDMNANHLVVKHLINGVVIVVQHQIVMVVTVVVVALAVVMMKVVAGVEVVVLALPVMIALLLEVDMTVKLKSVQLICA
jgi:hypothetical protein